MEQFSKKIKAKNCVSNISHIHQRIRCMRKMYTEGQHFAWLQMGPSWDSIISLRRDLS